MIRLAPRLRALIPALLAATSGVVALAGCQDDPSFSLRWRITHDPDVLESPEDVDELESAFGCSSVGLGVLQLTTRTPEGALMDVQELPCFPDAFRDTDGRANGPELEPGDYEFTLEALRDTGKEWKRCLAADVIPPAGWVCREPAGKNTDADGDDECPEEANGTVCEFARAEGSVTVVEGETAKPDELVLLAPPQCDDGVDNDGDGLTDLTDPACLIDPLGAQEIFDTSATLIKLDVSYLHQNPNASCIGLGIGRLKAQLVPPDGDPLSIADIACENGGSELPPYWVVLDSEDGGDAGPATCGEGDGSEGAYRLEVRAIKNGTENEDAVEPWSWSFDIDPDRGCVETHSIDFAPDSFLEPIESRLNFHLSFQSTPDTTRSCTIEAGAGLLQSLPRTRFTLLGGEWNDTDSSMEWSELDPATLNLNIGSLSPVFDGNTVTADCADAPIFSDPVVWGNFALLAEALEPGDEACFGSGDLEEVIRLAPTGGSTVTHFLPRVLDEEGLPPTACYDCVKTVKNEMGMDVEVDDDTDCGSTAHCVDRVCEE